jgi:hypothetical protein
MSESDPGLWPGILVFSPPLSYLCWTYGFGEELLQLSAAFVILAVSILVSKCSAKLEKHAPFMLISGMIQFVLVVPITGLVAQQDIQEMAGYSRTMSVAHAVDHLPAEWLTAEL